MIVVELMAPAGDWIRLRAAVQNGADAVYLGLSKLNMRATATNFSPEELPEVVKYCKEHNVRIYVTLNTIIFEHELDDLRHLLDAIKTAGIEDVICWDHAVIREAKKRDLKINISTQASISNSESALFYKTAGATRVVLARECSLEQIKEIKKELGKTLEIEIFIHGAMCVALSGRCFMSHHLFGRSANCGDCLQPCRREYLIYDEEEKQSLLVGKGYIMSPKDLCTIEFIDEILDSGVDSLKIEGRKRSPEYVATSVKAYREAIDLHECGKLTKEKKQELKTCLEKVYNRGFSDGFFHTIPSGEESITKTYGNKATEKKTYLGKVVNYYAKQGVAYIRIEADSCVLGDEVLFLGKTTGLLRCTIDVMRDEGDKNIEVAAKGESICIKVPDKVRQNDEVYIMRKVKVKD